MHTPFIYTRIWPIRMSSSRNTFSSGSLTHFQANKESTQARFGFSGALSTLRSSGRHHISPGFSGKCPTRTLQSAVRRGSDKIAKAAASAARSPRQFTQRLLSKQNWAQLSAIATFPIFGFRSAIDPPIQTNEWKEHQPIFRSGGNRSHILSDRV